MCEPRGWSRAEAGGEGGRAEDDRDGIHKNNENIAGGHSEKG